MIFFLLNKHFRQHSQGTRSQGSKRTPRDEPQNVPRHQSDDRLYDRCDIAALPFCADAVCEPRYQSDEIKFGGRDGKHYSRPKQTVQRTPLRKLSGSYITWAHRAYEKNPRGSRAALKRHLLEAPWLSQAMSCNSCARNTFQGTCAMPVALAKATSKSELFFVPSCSIDAYSGSPLALFASIFVCLIF